MSIINELTKKSLRDFWVNKALDTKNKALFLQVTSEDWDPGEGEDLERVLPDKIILEEDDPVGVRRTFFDELNGTLDGKEYDVFLKFAEKELHSEVYEFVKNNPNVVIFAKYGANPKFWEYVSECLKKNIHEETLRSYMYTKLWVTAVDLFFNSRANKTKN
jgi:hypothetical protein